jgi:hypothetical protein
VIGEFEYPPVEAMSYSQYLNNVVSTGGHFVNTMLGRKEYFVDGNGTVTETTASSPTVEVGEGVAMFIVILWFLLNVLIIILVGYGSARLSYCYNVFTGRSEGEAFFWSVLAFLFAGLYYPFYGIFLNPICGKKVLRNNAL